MIGAEFLGMIMLIVYVGAVAVLFFVVMMLNVAQQKNQGLILKKILAIFNRLNYKHNYLFELIIVIGGWKFKPELSDSSATQISNEISNTHSLGQVLYTDCVHVFQIVE